MEKISSKNNAKVKEAVRLARSSEDRRKAGRFMLEGARLCADAYQSDVEIERVFVTPRALNKFAKELSFLEKIDAESIEINEEISAKISDVMSPQGVFCICKKLDKSINLVKMKNDGYKSAPKYIALDGLQDPSNLGAIARTAEALGVEGLIVAGGCDIYNPKALRASMGAFFRLPTFLTDDLQALISGANDEGFLTYAALVADSALPINQIDFAGASICVIGNEGAGVSKEVGDVCKFSLTIPMAGRAESLNAAAAAAILIWEMTK